MENTTIIKQVIGGIVLLAIGIALGWNYYLSTPTGTINQIKQTANQGDYQAFQDCCFEEELVFDNIRKNLESKLSPEELVFSEKIVDNEINVGKLKFKSDFENSEVFNEINTDNLKKIDKGFTIQAQNKTGNTNLIIFQNMNEGRLLSFPNYKIVEIKTIEK